MRFAVGYQLPGECDCVSDMVADSVGQVAEVYFALPTEPSGRSPLGHGDGWPTDEASGALAAELTALARMDVGLVLLFNAACYGSGAMSYELAERVERGIEFAEASAPLKAVTTTSLFVAKSLKRERPDIPVRASVNLRIGSIAAMEQLADCFDGYYMKRELNRSPEAIDRLKVWCDSHGKTLHLLANSGCLHDCAYQSFHDNLVAHESEVARVAGRGVRFPAPCWEFLEDPGRWHQLLQNTWIRPEDMHHYEAWFDTVKLATRMHSHPRVVLGAYARGEYQGNLLDLLEPGHASLPGMPILDNSRFPDDWYERTTTCRHRCQDCSYCASVFPNIQGGSCK